LIALDKDSLIVPGPPFLVGIRMIVKPVYEVDPRGQPVSQQPESVPVVTWHPDDLRTIRSRDYLIRFPYLVIMRAALLRASDHKEMVHTSHPVTLQAGKNRRLQVHNWRAGLWAFPPAS
jgi:hypothetical protein